MNLISKFNLNTGLHVINQKESNNQIAFLGLPKLKALHSDVISFKAKNYDMSSIKSPTNHCAYCGAKVYTQRQLEILATELMQLKGNSLQGKIRSIEEKLGGKSENALSQKKREVNKENIDFFEEFTNEVHNNPSKTGLDILTEKFAIPKDEAPKFLLGKISPLLKTIDHVVPQRQDVDNDNEELNLVESCFTCNSKIKNGSTFRSFYFTYPTIKDNMPKEKFEFASLGILETSPDVIVSKMNTEELIRVIDGLFTQRQSIKTALFAIEEKIKNCANSIKSTIDKIMGERQVKEFEKQQLEDQNKTHAEDEEFQVLLRRRNLTSSIASLKDKINELSTTSSRYSKNIQTWKNKLNEIDNERTHGKKKGKFQANNSAEKEELQRKIFEGEENLKSVQEERRTLGVRLKKEEAELAELNEKYPDVDKLRAEKAKLESLISAHSQISQIKLRLADINSSIEDLKVKHQTNKAEQDKLKMQLPEAIGSSQEEKEEYQKYIDLTNALKEAEQNILSKDKSSQLIGNLVKPQLVTQIKLLESNPLVRRHILNQQIEELKNASEAIKTALKNAYTQKNNNEAQLVQLVDKIRAYTEETSGVQTQSKLAGYSLPDINSKIDTLTSLKAKAENELLQIPDDKEIEQNKEDSDTYREYSELLNESDRLNDELKKQMPRQERETKKKELEEITVRIQTLCSEDGSVFENNNLRQFEMLEAHLGQLKKGLQTASSPKEKAAHQKQIATIEDEISDLAEREPRVFNIMNARKREELNERIEKLAAQLKTAIEQRDEIEKALGLTGNIADGFSKQETETKIAALDEQIKRLIDKANWLELPERIKKIDAEIKIQDDNITSLENKLQSISQDNQNA